MIEPSQPSQLPRFSVRIVGALALIIVIAVGAYIYTQDTMNTGTEPGDSQSSSQTYSGVLVSDGEKYFLIKNGTAREVSRDSVEFVKQTNYDTTSPAAPFYINSVGSEIECINVADPQTRSSIYRLKEEGDLYEQMGQVLYSQNKKEALIRVFTFDKKDPVSEFGGDRPVKRVVDYRYDLVTNTLATTDILERGYSALGISNIPSQLGFQAYFEAWDSDKSRLYSMDARFGEGGDGALKAFSVIDTSKKTIIASLKPETEKTIEVPRLFTPQRKLVTIKRDAQYKPIALNVYSIDNPEKLENSVVLDVGDGNLRVDPLEFTSDNQAVLLHVDTSLSPYIYKGLLVNLATGKSEVMYTDETVPRDDDTTSPGSYPLFAPGDRVILYVDYTNLYPQPAGSLSVNMKAEDNRYDLISIDRQSKIRQVLYSSKTLLTIDGFVK